MALTSVAVSGKNMVHEGGYLFDTTYESTVVKMSKVVSNPRRCEKTTFSCYSSQAGEWIIYDVDSTGRGAIITTIAVSAGTLSIYTHAHILEFAYCTFEPDSAPGTETLIIRAITGGGSI